MSASITFALPTSSFHVIGQDFDACSLHMAKSGRRVHGVNPTYQYNDVVGYVTGTVKLYRSSRVEYHKEEYNGSTFHFSGTWEGLVETLLTRDFMPAFCGSSPGWVSGWMMKKEADLLAKMIHGGRVQKPEFVAWENQPRWLVAVDGRERPRLARG